MVKRFGVIIVIASLVVIGCRRVDSSNTTPVSANGQKSAARIDQATLEATYQTSLKDILIPYWKTGAVSGIKEKLLALTVPPKYLKLHLSLVLGIDMIEQGTQASDQSKIELGKKKITDSIKEFPWIKL